MKNRNKTAVLIAGAFIMLCTGMLYMWSIFQAYVISFHSWSAGSVSLTSSIMIACFVLGNITAGMLQEKIPPRTTAAAGAVLFSLGLYLTGIIDSGEVTVLYFTYGVIGGFGCGLSYSAVLAVLQKWYASQMGFITGIAVGFFGLSVIILAPFVQSFLNSVGLNATFKVLAAVFFIILTAASLFLKNPAKEYYYAEVTKTIKLENVKQFATRDMLKSPSFYYVAVSLFASSSAYIVIIPFIKTIAVVRGMPDAIALLSVMITGAANAAGRIFAPLLSDKIGRTRTIILCSVISSIGCVLIISATGVMYAAAVFLIALSYGGMGGTNPVITTELWGARYSGANYGLVLLSLAASSVVFGKLSASLSADGDFTVIFVLCALLCVVPVIMMLFLKRRVKRLGKTI